MLLNLFIHSILHNILSFFQIYVYFHLPSFQNIIYTFNNLVLLIFLQMDIQYMNILYLHLLNRFCQIILNFKHLNYLMYHIHKNQQDLYHSLNLVNKIHLHLRCRLLVIFLYFLILIIFILHIQHQNYHNNL